ncbi:UV DNA damage repair endonuclease UvsE [Paenibacillus hunanensis]|uniref:UV DNA damage endonuclease n=1 Tax=Paenibacillus hunanensis TaxID=539262 RepID=A0ABU1J3I2_9BACL|nr:UV DNA damage repair endonuclease UvsE [Paenibacillus hunanensis]MDR6246069.1 UV DNA damage endonuclease [Paenibacillus hunanensis]GGJ13923.1 UV damage endonuclease UvsE [Paenibacillus hunanensis]
MIVRFGYVAISLQLKDASPSKTMTMTNFRKLPDRDAALRRLEAIGRANLQTTLRVLKHNVAEDIHMYRMSSKLIPLATHAELQDWDPVAVLQPEFAEIGEYVRKHNLRVSFHPDHFTVINTPKPEVLEAAVRDLRHHVRMLDAMGLDARSKNNIHVGGAYGDKPTSGDRFVEQFATLDDDIRCRITLENDDKTFTTPETLDIAQRAGLPMVLDIHHHMVNCEGELASLYWPDIARTWESPLARTDVPEGSHLRPKIHASSPRSATDRRSHADGVEAGPLLDFLRQAARTSSHLDVMLEAKHKDLALLQLMNDLRALEGDGVRIIDKASIEVLP